MRAAALALRSRVPGLQRADVAGSAWCGPGPCGAPCTCTTRMTCPGWTPCSARATGPISRRRCGAGAITRPRRRCSATWWRCWPSVRWTGATCWRSWPDGRYLAAQPPPAADADLALATLARRYLAGYGPASAADLAWWSGLPLGAARRALAAAAPTETVGELFALPGTFEVAPPAAPPALLLAAFDTTMLGYRRREPLVTAGHDRRVRPGGGMLRPVVLIDGLAAGTWGVRVRAGRGGHRRLVLRPRALRRTGRRDGPRRRLPGPGRAAASGLKPGFTTPGLMAALDGRRAVAGRQRRPRASAAAIGPSGR